MREAHVRDAADAVHDAAVDRRVLDVEREVHVAQELREREDDLELGAHLVPHGAEEAPRPDVDVGDAAPGPLGLDEERVDEEVDAVARVEDGPAVAVGRGREEQRDAEGGREGRAQRRRGRALRREQPRLRVEAQHHRVVDSEVHTSALAWRQVRQIMASLLA